jgi:hypothetical protein
MGQVLRKEQDEGDRGKSNSRGKIDVVFVLSYVRIRYIRVTHGERMGFCLNPSAWSS